MEINFYQDYQDLSVPELVKVARSPWDYLPEAVTAAQRILRERGVSAEEIAAEEWALAQREMSDALEKDRAGDYFGWLRELLPEKVSEGLAVRPWVYIFLLLYALYYVYRIFHIIGTLVYFARCEVCRDTAGAVFSLLFDFVYLTTTLFLLLKQKPLGWALLFVQAIVVGFLRGFLFFTSYEHHAYLPLLVAADIVPFLIYAGVVVFLLRGFAMEFFGVSAKFRNVTALVAVVLAIMDVVAV